MKKQFWNKIEEAYLKREGYRKRQVQRGLGGHQSHVVCLQHINTLQFPILLACLLIIFI